MSFREVRSFTEMMRFLGYPRVISLENFRTANFFLVVEILKWFLSRYNSQEIIPQSLDSEQDRILFVKIAINFLSLKINTKLNGKRIYQANGYAVKELIKVTKNLFSAQKTCNIKNMENENSLDVTEIFDVNKVIVYFFI